MEALAWPEQKRLNIPSWIKTALGVTGLLGAAMYSDQWCGSKARSHLSTAPDFIVQAHEENERTLVVFGGTQSDGGAISEQIGPELAPHGNLVVVDYPKAGFDIQAITEGVFDTMRERGLREPSFIGGSMGGMAVAEALRFYQANELEAEFGPVGTAILDSTASRFSEIDANSRRLMRIAAAGGDSVLLNTLKSYQMRKHHPLAAASGSLNSVAAQRAFMINFSMEPGALAGITEQALYLDGPGDPCVNTEAAYENWNRVFGGELQPLRDPARPEGSHAGCLKGYPDAIAAQLARPLKMTDA